MQLIAGRTAQEYNQRKNRKGAFWEDRYHATIVQTDEHLARCVTYIDLNMVRAGAVQHPRDWKVCGYNEIQVPWRRKSVIDFDALANFLNAQTQAELALFLEERLQCEITGTRREPAWSESIAVGDDVFLESLTTGLGDYAADKVLVSMGSLKVLRSRTSH